MTKLQRPEQSITTEEEACEMIELASDELHSLTKVFHMLTALCNDINQELSDDDEIETSIH